MERGGMEETYKEGRMVQDEAGKRKEWREGEKI